MTGRASPPPFDIEVAVVGSGFCGLAMGIRLKEAGIPFVILERADDLGGTWRDNTYPGIAVDITSFTYSYSFEQNPAWSRVFSPGSELKAYADHCATRYGLRPHLRFGKHVTSATFDEKNDVWTLAFADGSSLRCRWLVNACGVLTQPKRPDIPGLDTFRGISMHTARWDHGVSLAGKRVGLIGTGATAIQIIPVIAKEVARLHVFQRTPIWILPKPDRPIPEEMKRLFRRYPITQTAVRMATSAATEVLMVIGLIYNRQAPWLIRGIERRCLAHLHAQVQDPVLREKLTPRYAFFCKRPSFSNELYPALSRPNVELVTESIERIDERGIVTRDGEHRELDVLILATGFLVTERANLPAFETIGVGGLSLGAFWDEHRLQAFEGASIPRFPNHFMMVGPYSVTGASWFSIAESQSLHALRCIQESRRRRATRAEVREKAHREYFEKMQRRMPNTLLFTQDCTKANSYYYDRHGDSPLIRPAPGIEQWWRSRFYDLNDYAYS
jgi:cation diffusion facilitator CzcD-associated flavoprotein CzcO